MDYSRYHLEVVAMDTSKYMDYRSHVEVEAMDSSKYVDYMS